MGRRGTADLFIGRKKCSILGLASMVGSGMWPRACFSAVQPSCTDCEIVWVEHQQWWERRMLTAGYHSCGKAELTFPHNKI